MESNSKDKKKKIFESSANYPAATENDDKTRKVEIPRGMCLETLQSVVRQSTKEDYASNLFKRQHSVHSPSLIKPFSTSLSTFFSLPKSRWHEALFSWLDNGGEQFIET